MRRFLEHMLTFGFTIAVTSIIVLSGNSAEMTARAMCGISLAIIAAASLCYVAFELGRSSYANEKSYDDKKFNNSISDSVSKRFSSRLESSFPRDDRE